MKFGHMILRKIFKFVATGCQIVGVNSISVGALPQTPSRELTALPRPSSSILGPSFKGEGIRNERAGRDKRGECRE